MSVHGTSRTLRELGPLAALVDFIFAPSSSSVHELSIGIFCRIILNGTQTVPLQHSHPIQGYCIPRPLVRHTGHRGGPFAQERQVDNPARWIITVVPKSRTTA